MEAIQFWLREAAENVRRNRLMSVLAISTVTIGLFILGAFYLSISNLRAAVSHQTQKLDLVVVLKPKITPARRKQIFNAARVQQVKKVDIVLASAALRKYGREMNVPVDDLLKDNPLGDELRVQLKNPEDFFKVRDYLSKINGVASVQNKEADEVANKLLSFNRTLTIGAVIWLVILAGAILLIIHNAIRLTLFARRREIRIMQLVGATPGFVRVPFLLEGVFYGLLGSICAVVVLSVLYVLTVASPLPLIQSLLPLTPADILIPCASLLMGIGILFGFIGANLSFSHSQKSL